MKNVDGALLPKDFGHGGVHLAVGSDGISALTFVSQSLQVKLGWIFRTTRNEAGTVENFANGITFTDEVAAAAYRA